MDMQDLIIQLAEIYDDLFVNKNENLLKKNAGKYDHIDFSVTDAMRAAAKRGLEARKKAKKSNKGGLSTSQAGKLGIGSGVARATTIINKKELSPETWRRIYSFFSRHEKNIRKAMSKKLRAEESKALQASLIWGGMPAFSRASKIVKQMDAADKK